MSEAQNTKPDEKPNTNPTTPAPEKKEPVASDKEDKSAAAAKAIREAEAATKTAEDAEAAAKAALAKAEAAKKAAENAAEAEYKAIADEVKAETTKSQDYTFKRQSEEIFRREMHEPEFFLDKKDRFPIPILSQEQQAELTRKVEIPVNNTPKYEPERVLSPEYGGVSHYESSIGEFLVDAQTRLEKLKSDPDTSDKDLAEAKHNVSYLESLHENYFLGMNVFRTAKGGRSKLKAK